MQSEFAGILFVFPAAEAVMVIYKLAVIIVQLVLATVAYHNQAVASHNLKMRKRSVDTLEEHAGVGQQQQTAVLMANILPL